LQASRSAGSSIPRSSPGSFVTGGVLSGLALVGISAGHGWIFEGVMMIALGVGFYMLHNSYQTQVTEVVPDARASAVAIHAFSFFVGQAIGVVVVGAGIGALGWMATMFLAAAMATALGIASAWVLVWGPQPRPR
jgi:predicted MFS family arabinose efflux permease